MAREHNAYGEMENLRKSNFAYNQTKIAEYISVFFALIGLGIIVVAYELRYVDQDGHDPDKNKDWIIALLWRSTASTMLLNVSVFFSPPKAEN